MKTKKDITVFIGSDHGGFDLKNHLASFLEKEGFKVKDFGTHSRDPVDYPDIAFLLARAVAEARSAGEEVFGIMIDAIGVASAMVCNRVPGIRAAVCWCEFAAESAREHNNAQVVTLGGRILGTAAAERILKVFLTTGYAAGRHEKRVFKIHALTGEAGFARGTSGGRS